MERSVNQGLAAFRWCAWLWMAAVLLISHEDLRPGRGAAGSVLGPGPGAEALSSDAALAFLALGCVATGALCSRDHLCGG